MSENDLTPERFGAAFKEFMEAVTAAATPRTNPLLERIRAHLGTDPTSLPVMTEEYDTFEHPNLQTALDAYLGDPGRRADLVGIGAAKRYGAISLSDFVTWGGIHGPPLSEGPVDYVSFHLADDHILSCVQLGLYLIHNGDRRLVALVAGGMEHSPNPKPRVEVLANRPEDAQSFLAEIAASMAKLNVYRGHTISLSPGQFGPGHQTLIAFHRLPRISRDDVILPEGVLERIERHTIVFTQQAGALLAAGRSLKRGLLLFGPPGVGKTLTVMYLAGQMPGRTVVLTTGLGLGLLRPVTQIARSLVPSMVVLEDVDLIAEQRGMPYGHTGPLLFELLNEMDGLAEDADVIFVLTTNRPDILEPALAARPGRIDLAVELPLPDADDRRRLLDLYARGLELQDVDLESVAARIEGATPAYIKELLRKAAVLAAAEGAGVIVTGAHFEAALAELDEGGRLAQRLLGFRPSEEPADQSMPSFRPAAPSGFPHRVTPMHVERPR